MCVCAAPVIKGWTEAMQLMKEGDEWELYIPSELGYGAAGAGADIPGGAALVFTMEIKKVHGKKTGRDFKRFEPSRRSTGRRRRMLRTWLERKRQRMSCKGARETDASVYSEG
jgi:hypothetical protein